LIDWLIDWLIELRSDTEILETDTS